MKIDKLEVFYHDRIVGTLAMTAAKKVAFEYNQGTFRQRVIFDLENNVRYVDDATPYTLTAEQKAVISQSLLCVNAYYSSRWCCIL